MSRVGGLEAANPQRCNKKRDLLIPLYITFVQKLHNLLNMKMIGKSTCPFIDIIDLPPS